MRKVAHSPLPSPVPSALIPLLPDLRPSFPHAERGEGKTRFWIFLSLALLLAAGCDTEGRPLLSQAPEAEETLTVTRGDFEARFLLTGELDAVTSDELQAPYTQMWTLSIRWMEEEGTLVKAGQKVLEFENSELASHLEAKKMAEMQAEDDLTIQLAQNDLTLAEKEFALERAKIALKKAELEANVPSDLLPLRDYEEKQLALERAKIAYKKAEEDLEAAKKSAALEVKLKKLALEKAKREIRVQEESIEALSLKATRDDILVIAENPREGRKLEVGDTVFPGMTVLKLPNLSVMEVKAMLSDVDEGRVVVGMPVTCFLDAYPDEPISGTIKQISPVAQEPVRESLRRSFAVLVSLDKTDPERMRPGMSVKVEVHAHKESNVLLVPRAAVDFRVSPPRVLLADGDVVEPLLGPCNAQECIVTEGLSEGAEVRKVGYAL